MAERETRPQAVVVTGLAAVSGCGRGLGPLLDRASAGEPAFGPVTRFDTGRYRVGVAAHLPGEPNLREELAAVVRQAAAMAGLSPTDLASAELLVAMREELGDTGTPASRPAADGARRDVLDLADRCGLLPPARVYTGACVAASTAVADAAAAVASGRAERVVVAAGYLVEEHRFALFDAGRALARDGWMRAFSSGRSGTLLGDGVAALIVESASAARRREATPLARIEGWGRAGDAYHVSEPHPQGVGLARAIRGAMARAGLRPDDIGYVNANGTSTAHSDPAEAAGLRAALGDSLERVPVSSSKTVHGHALEASGLLEFVLTVLAVRTHRLPVNAGLLDVDEQCRLTLVDVPRNEPGLRHALSVNSAFGGAHTALLVGAA